MEGNAPKISVVVPMYNVEKYLRLCISSILAQSFKDFELILIDDCSTDKTLEIAQSFSDSRIKILRNEKNLGNPGAVRNIGLEAAQGDYIYFCDNDDAILNNTLEKLYTAAENKFDIVNSTRWYIAKNPEFQNLKSLETILRKFSAAQPVSEDLKTRITQEFLQNKMHVAPWLFLYRRKFLIDNNIKFPDEVAEDVFFNFGAVCATSKIIKIDEPFYVYRNYQNSTQHNLTRISKNVRCLPVLIEYIKEKLTPLNDFAFTQKVLNYWTGHVIGSYILPFVSDKNPEVLLEMSNALQTHFGKNSAFVLTLLQVYSEVRLANVQNRKLKAENEKLKTALEKIQKEIAEVTKA